MIILKILQILFCRVFYDAASVAPSPFTNSGMERERKKKKKRENKIKPFNIIQHTALWGNIYYIYTRKTIERILSERGEVEVEVEAEAATRSCNQVKVIQ